MSDPATSPDKANAAPLAATVRPSLWSGLRAAFTSWWGPGPGGRPRESSDELAEDRTDLAATRTLMAADRTLMAWARTSLSLSSFGFTIYKGLQGIAEGPRWSSACS